MSNCIDKNELLDAIDEKNGRLPLWLAEILMECKVVDAVPEKHGKWITVDGISRCSECEYIPAYDSAIDDIYYSPYCPKCGAKMDRRNET